VKVTRAVRCMYRRSMFPKSALTYEVCAFSPAIFLFMQFRSAARRHGGCCARIPRRLCSPPRSARRLRAPVQASRRPPSSVAATTGSAVRATTAANRGAAAACLGPASSIGSASAERFAMRPRVVSWPRWLAWPKTGEQYRGVQARQYRTRPSPRREAHAWFRITIVQPGCPPGHMHGDGRGTNPEGVALSHQESHLALSRCASPPPLAPSLPLTSSRPAFPPQMPPSRPPFRR